MRVSRVLITLTLLFSLLIIPKPEPVFSAPPITNYYLIAVGANPTDTIGTADDPASGGTSCTLRDALDIASAGTITGTVNGCDITLFGAAPATPVYVINLPTGGYTYTIGDMFAGDLDIFNTTLHLVGDTPANTIIQAFTVPNTPNTTLRVFQLTNADVTMYNLTVRHGVFTVPFLGDGAGIYVQNTDLTLDNVIISDNTARGRGGGIYMGLASTRTLNLINGTVIENNTSAAGSIDDGGGVYVNGALAVNITSSTIRNNNANGDGGGLYLTGTTATITNTLFENNQSQSTTFGGGGIFNGFGATLNISGTTFRGNQVPAGLTSGGGAIYNGWNAGTVTIANNSLFENNSAPNGGAIFNEELGIPQPTITITDTTFTNNTGVREGGAIYNQGIANIGTVTNPVTFTNNEASQFGGGAITNSGTTADLNVLNSTFTGNEALGSGRGGGINSSGGDAEITSSIFDSNTARFGGGGVASASANTNTTITDSDFRNNQATTGYGGGILGAFGSTTLIQGTTIIGTVAEPNTAFSGGGIAVSDNSTTINANGTQIIGNTATSSGGGVSVVGNSTLNLNNATVADNISNGTGFGGGGAFVQNSTLNLNTTLINNNRTPNGTSSGGGIYANIFGSASVSVNVLNDSQVNGNTAVGDGGGIAFVVTGIGDASESANLTITDSQVNGNTAGTEGGGISLQYTRSGTPNNVNITASLINANQAGSNGGGIAVEQRSNGQITLNTNGVTLNNNTAATNGGGAWLDGIQSPELTFSNTVFSNNRAAAGFGGGLAIDAESLSAFTVNVNNGTQFDQNQAGTNGGAIYVDALATFNNIAGVADLQINDATFNQNIAGDSGGAVYQSHDEDSTSSSTITNAQFISNTATGNGGAVYLGAGTMTVTNSVHTGNIAPNGGAYYQEDNTLNVTGSCIVNNSDTAVNTLSAVNQTFTGNWWGAVDGPSGAGFGQGDSVSTNIDFSSTLTAPPAGLTCPSIPVPEINVQQSGIDIPDDTGSFDFGTTTVGNPILTTFTVQNVGTADLTLINPINVPANFSVDTTFGATNITTGNSTTFVIQCDASAVGTHTGQISFDNGDNDENPYNFDVSCEVNAAPEPEIQVEDSSGSAIPNGGLFTFGTATTIGVPISEAITVTNIGTAALTITTDPPTTTGDFSASNFGALTLNPGDSTTFDVACDATAIANPAAGTVSFDNNDASENPFNFNVACIVNAIPEPEIQVEDSSGSIIANGGTFTFAATTVGNPVTETFTVRNVGSALLDLTTNPANITGDFSRTAFGAASLNVGAFTTFEVTCDATTPATPSTGIISFDNTDGDENPFDFNLACDVTIPTAAEIQVLDSNANALNDGDAFAFSAPTTLGTPITETFTITNIGTALLTITTDPPTTTGDFTAGNFGVLTLNPTESTTVDLTCNASVAGVVNGSISFANSDADENPFDLTVTCTVGVITPPVVNLNAEVNDDDDDDEIDLPAPPPAPLCADVSGETDEIVRANIPPQVSLTIFCRVIARDQQFIRTSAEIGIQRVLERGVIHAVDVFSTSGMSGAGSRVCLRGSGNIIFIAEVTGIQPETAIVLTPQPIDGYTCAIIRGNGKVVLVRD